MEARLCVGGDAGAKVVDPDVGPPSSGVQCDRTPASANVAGKKRLLLVRIDIENHFWVSD